MDYGTRRTGLAVTDPGRMIASPLETVPTHELMHYLDAYFSKGEVETLVVGLPLEMDGTESQSMKPLRYFIRAFGKRFPAVNVEWADERFTSIMARSALLEGGMKKKGRRDKSNVDKVSAALILQTWLDSKTIRGGKR